MSYCSGNLPPLFRTLVPSKDVLLFRTLVPSKSVLLFRTLLPSKSVLLFRTLVPSKSVLLFRTLLQHLVPSLTASDYSQMNGQQHYPHSYYGSQYYGYGTTAAAQAGAPLRHHYVTTNDIIVM